MASGVPRARTEARGWVVGGRLRSASLLTASHGCCLLLCLFVACAKPETWPSSVCPPSLGFSRPRLRFRRVDFTSWPSCRSQFLAAAGKKRERYISDGKVGSLAPGPRGGGGGGSRACSLGLVSGSARRTRRGARRNDDGHEARGQWPGQEVSARIPVIPASLSRRAVGARQSSAESSRLRCCLSFSFALTSPSIILVSDFLSFFSRAGSREPTCSRSGGEAVVARWPTGRRPRSPSPRATS